MRFSWTRCIAFALLAAMRQSLMCNWKEAQLYYHHSTRTQYVHVMVHANHASIQVSNKYCPKSVLYLSYSGSLTITM